MAQRHGAAIDVHACGVDAQLAEDGDHLHREGLVDLEQIHVAQATSRLFFTSRLIASTGVMSTYFGASPLAA